MPEKKTSNESSSVVDTLTKKREATPVFTERIPTGCDLLDTIVGGGEGMGFPVGRIINLVGDKSTGKTFFACEIIAAAYNMYKKRLKWVYDDCESGFSFDTKKMYGIEIMPIDYKKRTKSKMVESAYCNIREFLESLDDDDIGIYVLDSLDALNDKEGKKIANEQYSKFIRKKTSTIIEKEEKEKGSYRMAKPKYLSNTFFPELADLIEKKNALIIIISQIRYNLDPMSFEKFTRAGGKAMDHYGHTALWLAVVNKIKRKGRSVGGLIKVRAAKSKTPRPFREGFITILFDYGIDNTATSIDFLFDFLTPTGMVEKNASAAWKTAIECTMTDLKKFLIDINKETYYRKNIHPKLKYNELLEWIESDIRIKKKFDNAFSSKMKRAELIDYIEENKLQNELKERTLEKWESIENSIKTNRRPKYQDS